METSEFNFCAQIKKFRQAQGISQEEVGKACGVSSQAVSKWENARSLPDLRMLPILAKLFGCTIDELFYGKSDTPLGRSRKIVFKRYPWSKVAHKNIEVVYDYNDGANPHTEKVCTHNCDKESCTAQEPKFRLRDDGFAFKGWEIIDRYGPYVDDNYVYGPLRYSLVQPGDQMYSFIGEELNEPRINLYVKWSYLVRYIEKSGETPFNVHPEMLGTEEECRNYRVKEPKEVSGFLYWLGSDGKRYQAGHVITEVCSDIVLRAVYQKEGAPVTVLFDANGGTGNLSLIIEANGTVIVLPVGKLVNGDYQLLGWDPDRESSVPRYKQLDLFEMKENVILYAIWGRGVKP